MTSFVERTTRLRQFGNVGGVEKERCTYTTMILRGPFSNMTIFCYCRSIIRYRDMVAGRLVLHLSIRRRTVLLDTRSHKEPPCVNSTLDHVCAGDPNHTAGSGQRWGRFASIDLSSSSTCSSVSNARESLHLIRNCCSSDSWIELERVENRG